MFVCLYNKWCNFVDIVYKNQIWGIVCMVLFRIELSLNFNCVLIYWNGVAFCFLWFHLISWLCNWKKSLENLFIICIVCICCISVCSNYLIFLFSDVIDYPTSVFCPVKVLRYEVRSDPLFISYWMASFSQSQTSFPPLAWNYT